MSDLFLDNVRDSDMFICFCVYRLRLGNGCDGL